MSSESVKKRRGRILTLLDAGGVVPIGDIRAALSVSEETIRKDLIAMESQGILVRRHGSAELNSRGAEQALDVRATVRLPQKERIAAAALELISGWNSDVIGIDSGSTTGCFAALLARQKSQTIITNSMLIANAFTIGESAHSVYCAGGLLRSVDKSLYGTWTRQCLRSVRMSVSFLGTNGVRNWNGVGAISYEDADVKAAFVSSSARAIALLDSSKFGADTLLEAVPWDQLYAVITDEGIADSDRERVEKHTRLIIA